MKQTAKCSLLQHDSSCLTEIKSSRTSIYFQKEAIELHMVRRKLPVHCFKQQQCKTREFSTFSCC